MRGTVPVRCLQLIANIARRRQRQARLGNGRAGNGRSRHPASRDTRTSLYVVTAQPLQLLSLVTGGRHPGMQRKTGDFRYSGTGLFQAARGRQGLQAEGLASLVRAHGNTVRLQGCRR